MDIIDQQLYSVVTANCGKIFGFIKHMVATYHIRARNSHGMPRFIHLVYRK